MRHSPAPYLAVLAASLVTAPAEARKVTIRQQGAPEVTLTVAAGWKVQERRKHAVLARGARRVVLYQCPGWRFVPEEGVGLTAIGDRFRTLVWVRGGSCLGIKGASKRFGERLRPVLGRGEPAPPSDAASEQLARAARERTLAQPRIVGTASAKPFGHDFVVESVFEYDGDYMHQTQRLRGATDEVVRDATGNYLRIGDERCWGTTGVPEEDDALEPLLELKDWDAPPSTKTAWHVSYKPAEALPDGTIRVRWTGFVADGEAIIGADGLLRRVRIEDHHQARGRTTWQTVEVVFTGFPATLPHVSPTPACN